MTLLFMPRWIEVLVALYRLDEVKRYQQQLYRACPGSCSHTKVLLRTFCEYGLIRIKRTSYINWIVFTPQGEKLSEQLMQARWTLISLVREREILAD